MRQKGHGLDRPSSHNVSVGSQAHKVHAGMERQLNKRHRPWLAARTHPRRPPVHHLRPDPDAATPVPKRATMDILSPATEAKHALIEQGRLALVFSNVLVHHVESQTLLCGERDWCHVRIDITRLARKNMNAHARVHVPSIGRGSGQR